MEISKKMKTKLGNVMNIGGSTLEQFVEILNLPDEVFDSIYPVFKNQMFESFEKSENQAQIISQLKLYPIEELREAKETLPDFINEITDDEDLSPNKKDLIGSILKCTLSIMEQIVEGGGRQFVSVKITKLNPEAIIPKYAHPTDAGADVCAVEETKIEPGETKIVKTGIAVAIPVGYEIQVRPRSGLSLKSGLRIANAPGTIDTDYRGEIGIIMTNTGDIPYVIDKGMKIAQLVISQVPRIKWDEVETIEALGTTERGEGGFGSTGTKS